MERLVHTSGNRILRVEEAGDPKGRPVLVLHGMPGAGVFYGPHVTDALEKGIRLITYDRPGYGGSTASSGRSVGDCAEDVNAIADALEIDRLAVWGVSGGGPYALASGALLAGRVVAVGTLASPAPYGAPGLDFFAGMGQANINEIKLMLEDEAAAKARLGPEREAMLALQPDQLAEQTGSREFADFLVRGFRAGLAPGGDGWWDDSVAQLHPWGFEVDSIGVPVQLWHGQQDTFVPFGHGEWLAKTIPGVDAHLTDDSHGSVLRRHIPQLHGWLLNHF